MTASPTVRAKPSCGRSRSSRPPTRHEQAACYPARSRLHSGPVPLWVSVQRSPFLVEARGWPQAGGGGPDSWRTHIAFSPCGRRWRQPDGGFSLRDRSEGTSGLCTCAPPHPPFGHLLPQGEKACARRSASRVDALPRPSCTPNDTLVIMSPCATRDGA
jgi:hypothetical protein